MSQPVHFAFFVCDLPSTRRFYGEAFGCREDRSTETWADFDFFGNQISARTTGSVTRTQNTGDVEELLVPVPHFGALLGWSEFELDPSGNAPEFKSFKHPEHVFRA